MKNVVFVVPYAMEATLRFVRAMTSLPDVQVGIISQEKLERLPADVRRATVAFERVRGAVDADQLTAAVRAIASAFPGRSGHVDTLVGILEQLQEPLAEVRETLGIRGMSPDEARNFRDKALMKDVLRANDLPCARYCLARDSAQALAFAGECLPLVAKPPAGAGARNTMRVESVDDLRSYLRTVPATPESPLLLEEFVIGREYSFDSVSLGGRHVFHSISHYHPTPLEVMEHPWIQWCVVLPRSIEGDAYDDIRAAGSRALSALGMVTGLTHMEWFRRPDGSIAISEVAARPPGAQFTSLLSFAHDLDFYRAWSELMVFERFEVPDRSHAVGALFLRGQGSGRVKTVHGLEQAREELGPLFAQAKIPQPGHPPAESYEGEGYVILRHPETEAVEAGLRRLLELVRVELG